MATNNTGMFPDDLNYNLSQNNGYWTDPKTGKIYAGDYGPQGAGGSWNGDQYTPPSQTGYRVTEAGGPLSEREYSGYDMQGNSTGTGRWAKDGGGFGKEAMMMAAILGTVGFAGSALAAGGAAGGAGGAAGGAGAGGSGAAAGGYSALTPGAGFTELGLAGEGAFTGTNVLGGAATGSGVGGATLLGAGAGGGGAAGGATAAGTAASSAGGLSSLLGPGAAVAGGLLGGQGNKTSQTTKMDPRLDGFVYGEGGIVPTAQGLLKEQSTPEARAGYLKMMQAGQGLLANPVAGNGYGQIKTPVAGNGFGQIQLRRY